MICSAFWHGTAHAYDKYGCRCPEAVEAHRAKNRRQARRRYIRGRLLNLFGGRTGIDPVAVERAIGGDRSIVLTAQERAAAIDRLDAYGLSAAEVAHRLGCTTRTVNRHRARRKAQGEAA